MNVTNRLWCLTHTIARAHRLSQPPLRTTCHFWFASTGTRCLSVSFLPTPNTDSIDRHATMGNWWKDQRHSFVWIISTAIV